MTRETRATHVPAGDLELLDIEVTRAGGAVRAWHSSRSTGEGLRQTAIHEAPVHVPERRTDEGAD